MYTMVNGIVVAPPRQHYELLMQHEEPPARLRTIADSFDALLDVRQQLTRLGYQFVSLLPIAPSER
jgi:hypothetical protein